MEEFEIEGKKEFNTSSNELVSALPTEIIGNFYKRLDAIINAALSESNCGIACEKGCSYCCYYKVVAKPVEIFKIVKFVKHKFNSEQIDAIIKQTSINTEEAKSLTSEQHLSTNQRCPFLIDDSCSIYEVRPSKCRNHHAVEAELCKKSFEEPTNLSIPNSCIESLYLRANGASHGFEQAVEKKGFDSNEYDLNSAFMEAFQNSSLLKRYRKGKRAFIHATRV